MEVDLPDANIWTYVADHEADSEYSEAHKIYEEAINAERAVCIPTYVLAEFYRTVDRVQEPDKTQVIDPYTIYAALQESDTVFCPNPSRQVQYAESIHGRRRRPETYTVSQLVNMEAKDAPILSYAVQVRDFVHPNVETDSISGCPPSSEPYRLKTVVDSKGLDDLTIRILTYESDFVSDNELPEIDGVYVKNYQAD